MQSIVVFNETLTLAKTLLLNALRGAVSAVELRKLMTSG